MLRKNSLAMRICDAIKALKIRRSITQVTKPVDVKPSSSPELELIWSEDFDSDLSSWNQDDHIVDPLHRTGYKHLELDGSINTNLDYIKVPGRHAALMDKHRDKVQSIRNGQLVMKGHAIKTPNPYRKNFADKPYGDWLVSGGWLSTWGRKWSEEHKRQITDWDRTKLPLLGPGHVLQVRADLSNLMMRGARFSIWGMPATADQDTPEREIPAKVIADKSYDKNPAVMEIDLLENENPARVDADFGHIAFMKCVGGDAGDTENGAVNVLKDHGINIRKGFHTYQLTHNHDGTLDFRIDGVLINHEPRKITMWWYVILSNEFCSGCKDPKLEPNIAAHEHHSDGPYQPVDAGLSGRSCIDDIDLIDQHEAVIDYVRAFKILQ